MSQKVEWWSEAVSLWISHSYSFFNMLNICSNIRKCSLIVQCFQPLSGPKIHCSNTWSYTVMVTQCSIWCTPHKQDLLDPHTVGRVCRNVSQPEQGAAVPRWHYSRGQGVSQDIYPRTQIQSDPCGCASQTLASPCTPWSILLGTGTSLVSWVELSELSRGRQHMERSGRAPNWGSDQQFHTRYRRCMLVWQCLRQLRGGIWHLLRSPCRWGCFLLQCGCCDSPAVMPL